MLTDSAVTNRRRKRSNTNQPQTRMIADSDAQLYRELAQASGGQAIEVTKAELQAATAVMTQSMNSSLVNVNLDLSSFSSKMINLWSNYLL